MLSVTKRRRLRGTRGAAQAGKLESLVRALRHAHARKLKRHLLRGSTRACSASAATRDGSSRDAAAWSGWPSLTQTFAALRWPVVCL
jgi:hypothetical protein